MYLHFVRIDQILLSSWTTIGFERTSDSALRFRRSLALPFIHCLLPPLNKPTTKGGPEKVT